MGCVGEKPKNVPEKNPNPTATNSQVGAPPAAPANPPSRIVQQPGRMDNNPSNSNLAQPAPDPIYTNAPGDSKIKSEANGYAPAQMSGSSRVKDEPGVNNPQASKASDFENMLNNEERFGGNVMESDARYGSKMSHQNNPYTVTSQAHQPENVAINVHPPGQSHHQQNSSVIRPTQSNVVYSNLQNHPPLQEERGGPPAYPLSNTESRLIDPSNSAYKPQQASHVKIHMSGQSNIAASFPPEKKPEENVNNLMSLLASSKMEDGQVVPGEGEAQVEGYLWNSGFLKIGSN